MICLTGYQLVVHDAVPAVTSKFVSEGSGATAASSPAQLGEMCGEKGAAAIISMVPEGSHMREVYLGSDGVLKGSVGSWKFKSWNPLMGLSRTVAPAPPIF